MNQTSATAIPARATRRPSVRLANTRKYCALVFAIAAADLARSQSAAELQARSDIYAARGDAVTTTLSATDRSDLAAAYESRGNCHDTFSLKPSSKTNVGAGGQLSYNSDPSPAVESPGDWHAHPDVKASYDWQGSIRFDGAVDVNSDRYLSTASANYDEASAVTKLSLSDGRDCGGFNTFFYFSNKLTDDFMPFYSSSKSRVDAITVGASGSLPFGFIDGRLQRTSMGDAGYVFTFDVSGGRQQVSPTMLNGTIVVLTATLTVPFNDSWAFGLGPTLKQTWRDSGATHSLLSVNNLVAKWTPPVPDAFNRKLEINFIESFSDTRSSSGSTSITQNDIGPSLVWSWKW